MAIIKSIPSRKIINGLVFETSELSLVSETEYKTTGESCIVVRNVNQCTIILDSTSTDHVILKAMTNVTVKPLEGKIDEEYDEIYMDKFSSIEFRFVGGTWYILSSDGLKS